MKKSESNQVFFRKNNELPSFNYYSPLRDHPNSSFQSKNYGENHELGKRKTQEDACLVSPLTTDLNPIELAKRLWTTLKILDEQLKSTKFGVSQGSTACVACVLNDELITANVADSVLFAALFNQKGQLLGVTRLTQSLHKPYDREEEERIEKNGAYLLDDRVNGDLAMSRALGDHRFNKYSPVIIPDAELSIYSIKQLIEVLNPENEPVGELKFIMTCDGFTEAADHQGTQDYLYLHRCLKAISQNHPEKLTESKLAILLSKDAIDHGSLDNVTVAIYTYLPNRNNSNLCFTIFDGHGGKDTVHHIVENFSPTFNQQLALTKEEYQKQPQSAENNSNDFLRDNDAMEKKITPYQICYISNERDSSCQLF